MVDRPELLGLPVGNTKDSHRRRWEETKAKPFRAADTRKSDPTSGSNRSPVAQGAGNNMNLVELQIEAHAIANPARVQRRRTKGWRMPANTVYVGRPTKWGNPYTTGSRRVNTIDYALHLRDNPYFVEEAKRQLKGKNLACWCPLDQPCHAGVLLEVANGPN